MGRFLVVVLAVDMAWWVIRILFYFVLYFFIKIQQWNDWMLCGSVSVFCVYYTCMHSEIYIKNTERKREGRRDRSEARNTRNLLLQFRHIVYRLNALPHPLSVSFVRKSDKHRINFNYNYHIGRHIDGRSIWNSMNLQHTQAEFSCRRAAVLRQNSINFLLLKSNNFCASMIVFIKKKVPPGQI